MPPSKVPLAMSSLARSAWMSGQDSTLEEDASDVRHEHDAVGSDARRDRGRRLVGVDVERSDRDRSDDRDTSRVEAGGDRLQAPRDRLSDEAELRDRQRFEPDLVADEMNGRGAERGGQLGPDGDQRRTHDGEGRWIREPPTADEPDRDPTAPAAPR